MVSLASVEAMVQGLWPEFNHVVVTLPDPRKGEQIVLVTDKPAADRGHCSARQGTRISRALGPPRASSLRRIPVLGNANRLC